MIKYKTGKPTERGVYACRVDDLDAVEDFRLLTDVFLMWYDEKWWYLKSDQSFRGPVHGWVGPMQRKLT